MGRERIINKVRLCLATLAFLATGGDAAGYFGRLIGQLEPLHHQVQGEVYAVDSRTIHIRGFSYDGTAPDAFFYGGSTPNPSEAGFIIPDENGGVQPLGRYRNQDITLTLPDGKTLKDITWISVWCRAFAIDFGNVRVPARLDYPRPQKIDALPTYEHGVSSDRIVVVDAQTFLIPNFSYDGQAPDGHFWVGKGATPGPSGNMVPDENGSEEPLKRYSGKTIVITLPGDQTVFDIDHLSVWCRAFFADFGHVRVPRNLNVPPSLKMLGVAPQSHGSGYAYAPPSPSRPSFSYAPQTTPTPRTTSPAPPPRPRYSFPSRPVPSPRPAYDPAGSGFPARAPPASPPVTTRRPSYRPPAPTTRRPFYTPRTTPPTTPPTTTRRPYTRPTTTRVPYHLRTTTRRPPYTTRPPRHGQYKAPSATHGRPNHGRPNHDLKGDGRSDAGAAPAAGAAGGSSRFPPALRTKGSSSSSSSHSPSSSSSSFPPRAPPASSHFGLPRHRFAAPPPQARSSPPEAPSAPQPSAPQPSAPQPSAPQASRSSSAAPPSQSFSSFSFSNGGASSFFNIYG